MRPILLTLMLVLLLTGSGEAGDTSTEWAVTPGGQIWVIGKWINTKGETCIQYTRPGQEMQTTCMPTCEQRMRDAMAKANEYLPHPQPDLVFDDLIPRYCDRICKAEDALKEAKKKTAVLNQWTSVMRDCVKETP